MWFYGQQLNAKFFSTFPKKDIFNGNFFKLTLREPKFPEDNQIFYPPYIVIFYHIILSLFSYVIPQLFYIYLVASVKYTSVIILTLEERSQQDLTNRCTTTKDIYIYTKMDTSELFTKNSNVKDTMRP